MKRQAYANKTVIIITYQIPEITTSNLTDGAIVIS